MLETGKPFVNFALQNQDDKQMKLGDFAGQWLVVYVYPKDDTPGCTIQGKSFTASKADFDAAGIKVVGVSADDVASHKNFCNKFAFTIDLLADTNARPAQGGRRRADGLQRDQVLEPHELRHRSQGQPAQGLRKSESAGA